MKSQCPRQVSPDSSSGPSARRYHQTTGANREKPPAQSCRGIARSGEPCRITRYLDSNGYCSNHREQCFAAPSSDEEMDIAQHCRGMARSGAPCRITRYLDSNGHCSIHREEYYAEEEEEDSVGYESESWGGYPHDTIHHSYHHNTPAAMFVGDHQREEHAARGGGCSRCGRTNHRANSCYATKHVDGYYLRRR